MSNPASMYHWCEDLTIDGRAAFLHELDLEDDYGQASGTITRFDDGTPISPELLVVLAKHINCELVSWALRHCSISIDGWPKTLDPKTLEGLEVSLPNSFILINENAYQHGQVRF